MTYRELKLQIDGFTDKELDQQVNLVEHNGGDKLLYSLPRIYRVDENDKAASYESGCSLLEGTVLLEISYYDIF